MPRRDALEDPRSASPAALEVLIGSADPEVLLGVLDNPALHESLLCRLLERKDAPSELLRRVAQRAGWIRAYPVKLRLARHPHTPRLIALACVRQLFLFDLARVSLLPSALAEVRRVAEDLVLNRLAQLPVGQKITLAKQGPARVAAALLAEGLPSTLAHVLENAHLNEAQITRVLARMDLSARVVNAVARHPKWSNSPQVRIALLRHPLTPLARIMAFLPDIPLSDLRDIMQLTSVRADLRLYLAHEVARRAGKGRPPAEG
ncbi:MAG TPA: hypothetical protein VLW54_02650 [Candidatus Acidoferrales bacterium]|nr:hypothetical protein [Candidatus Acidoferrales bacterium]